MEGQTQKEASVRGSFIDKLGGIIIIALGFLLPLFFVSSTAIPLESAKVIILITGIGLALLLFIVSIIRKGYLELPKHKILFSTLVIPIIFFLSSFSGLNPKISLFGYGFETGTFGSVLLGFLLLLLVPTFVRSKEQVTKSFAGFLIGFILLGLFSSIKFIFGADTLVFKVFSGISSNSIGSWTDLAVFFGLGAALALMSIEMLSLKKIQKIVLYFTLILCLFVLVVLNFSFAWIALASLVLIFFVYKFFWGNPLNTSDERAHKISYLSLVLLAIALLFFFNPSIPGKNLKLADAVSKTFNVVNADVRPSLATTLNVAKPVLAINPLLGSGPNTFGFDWLMYKPEGINSTNFWNVSFPYGFSLLATFLVTTGILGFLSWILFLIVFIWLGVKTLFAPAQDNLSKFLLSSSFLGALYLWVMTALYAPGIVIFSLAFFFTGLFIATAISGNQIARTNISFAHNLKLSFMIVLGLIALFVGSATFSFIALQKVASGIYYQKALIAGNRNNDFETTEINLNSAIDLASYDIYYRTLSELSVIRMRQIANQTTGTVEERQKLFGQALSDSISHAQTATKINGLNYQNWITLGTVYESLVPAPLSVQGAYTNAKATYEEALKRNPYSPEIYFFLARLEMTNKNNQAARGYINQSLALKNDYADAYFLLTQIEIADNNLTQAIRAAEAVAILSPNNSGVFFQLGLLKYNNADYTGAVQALSKAIAIVPEYANAKYFLGLSLYKLGQNDLAIKEFEDLTKTNPENTEVVAILKNLQDKKDPFYKISPPVNSSPEKGRTPPITNQ